MSWPHFHTRPTSPAGFSDQSDFQDNSVVDLSELSDDLPTNSSSPTLSTPLDDLKEELNATKFTTADPFDLVDFDALCYAPVSDWEALQYIKFAKELLLSKPRPLKQADHCILETLSTTYDRLIDVCEIKTVKRYGWEEGYHGNSKARVVHNFRRLLNLARSTDNDCCNLPENGLNHSSELLQFQEALQIIEKADIWAPLTGKLTAPRYDGFDGCYDEVERCIGWIGKLNTHDTGAEYDLEYVLGLIREPDLSSPSEVDQELKGFLTKACAALE
ncbi:MAG: hypothetical protein L6R41_003194 [Letrouitia leprolyta]|nr:MAG: hypothetical protein L6R41_003194 [Letrouitia leprolyta]